MSSRCTDSIRPRPTAAATSFAAWPASKDGVALQRARRNGHHRRPARAAVSDQQHRPGRSRGPLLESMVGESRPVLLLLMAAVVRGAARRLRERGQPAARPWHRAGSGARAPFRDRRRSRTPGSSDADRKRRAEPARRGRRACCSPFAATRVLTVLAAAGMPRADQIRLDATVLAVRGYCVAADQPGLRPDAGDPAVAPGSERVAQGRRQTVLPRWRAGRPRRTDRRRSRDVDRAAGRRRASVRSLWQLQDVDPGFNTEQVLTMEVSLPMARYEEGDQMPFYQQLQERVRGLTGVTGVGAVNILPLSSNYDSRGVQIEDDPRPDGQGALAASALGHARILRGHGHSADCAAETSTPTISKAARWWCRERVDGAQVLAERRPMSSASASPSTAAFRASSSRWSAVPGRASSSAWWAT